MSGIGACVLGPEGVYRLEIDAPALSINEQRLVAKAQAGDRLAFEELVRIHADRLYGVVLRLCATPHEAEEVTQETFIRAWRAIARFDGRSQLFTWLYRIGVNEAKRRLQRGERTLRTVSPRGVAGRPAGSERGTGATRRARCPSCRAGACGSGPAARLSRTACAAGHRGAYDRGGRPNPGHQRGGAEEPTAPRARPGSARARGAVRRGLGK